MALHAQQERSESFFDPAENSASRSGESFGHKTQMIRLYK